MKKGRFPDELEAMDRHDLERELFTWKRRHFEWTQEVERHLRNAAGAESGADHSKRMMHKIKIAIRAKAKTPTSSEADASN